MKNKKFILGLLCSAFLVSSTFGVQGIIGTADEIEENSITSEISIDQDFDGKSVLVVMTEEMSEINKVYDKSFFGDIEISSIEDLTYITGDITDKEYLNTQNFCQILQLHLPIDSKENVLEVINQVEQITGVESASPNYYDSFEEVPEDDFYEDLWGLNGTNGINAPQAWDITTGNSSVKVGIIDSGIANHPDLSANLVAGWDFHNDNSITSDDPIGHGTHIAGTIGAVGDNDLGVAGINWNVSLVPLQVARWNEDSQQWGVNIAAIVKAIVWATNNNIPILNHSIGISSNGILFSLHKAAIKNYTGLFVCSAGNEGEDVDVNPHYPSDYCNESNASYNDFSDRVISVGALNSNGERRTSSNYGINTVSIYAPGGNIYSTVPTSISSTGYNYKSGTSMAAPHVAGVAALLLAEDSTLTASELKDKILAGADTIQITLPNGGQHTVKKLNALGALEDYWYEVSDFATDKVEITTVRATLLDEISIPETIDGKTVVSIGTSAFAGQTQITEVEIPATVWRICSKAFQGCTALQTVTGMSGVTTINDEAFKDCSALENLPYMGALITIGNSAFWGCSSLEFVHVGGALLYIGDYAFYGATNLTEIIYIGDLAIQTIGTGAFYNCSKFNALGFWSGEMVLPSIVSIGMYAFKGTNFSEVQLGDGLQYIGNQAFANNPDLVSVTFTGDALPSVGTGVFSGAATSFRFYCAQSLIDSVTETSAWYAYLSVMEPIE
ncbi:MAG: hypothetical protein E7380_02505 [Clostridiales bacterium]|nr:hypothetical protein [Clostridiales bacterium]